MIPGFHLLYSERSVLKAAGSSLMVQCPHQVYCISGVLTMSTSLLTLCSQQVFNLLHLMHHLQSLSVCFEVSLPTGSASLSQCSHQISFALRVPTESASLPQCSHQISFALRVPTGSASLVQWSRKVSFALSVPTGSASLPQCSHQVSFALCVPTGSASPVQ